jgi:hypothetical protein
MGAKGKRRGEWGWHALAAFLVLLAAFGVVGGLANYFPNQARATQYTAAPRCPAGPVRPEMDCVQWVVAEVTGNQNTKNQDTLSLADQPSMTFTDPSDPVVGLRSGDVVQLPLWHGGANGVSVGGRFFYADQSIVQRPMHDLVFAMLGASALIPMALFSIVPALRRRGLGRRAIRTVKWVFGGLSAALVAEAVGTVTLNSLWGGPPFVAVFVVLVTVLTLLALGVIWIAGRFKRIA